jgi:hypothetical protein
MSADLDRRLRGLADVAGPAPDATARARAASLAAVPGRGGVHRRLWPALAVAALAAAILAGAASLAATGNLRVELRSTRSRTPPAPSRLVLPRGTHGIALVAGGRLWLATRAGLRIEGMHVSAAELSPRALYAVVGVGSSLVALAPGARRAWTSVTPGRVVAAAWSPDGLKIAYVVRARRGAELRMIEGDGDHDRLLDRRVATVKPAWRSDSLAVTYVRAGGRVAILDFAHGTRRVLARRYEPPLRAAARAPVGSGRLVAVRVPGGLELRLAAADDPLLRVRVPPSAVAISWR